MKYKLLLFILLSIFSYSAYSMEAVVKPEVQEISRCERKFKEIIDELKALNTEIIDLNWDALDRIIKRILKNIFLENSLEEPCYQHLSEAILEISLLNKPGEKIAKFIITVGELFSFTLMELTNINNHSRAEFTVEFDIQKLYIKLLLGIDLIDIWLEYVRNNKVKQFEGDFLTIEEKNDLEEDISTYISQNDIQNLTKLIDAKYTDFIDLDLLNKYDSNGIFILHWLIMSSFSLFFTDASLYSNLKNLIYKLINAPKLLISSLCLVKQGMTDKLKQFISLSQLTELANEPIEDWHNYLKAIDFRLDRIDNLKAKLFDAVNSQDENGNSIDLDLVRRRAYELYSITRDFQNSNGDTPLHIAVLLKNKELITTLLGIYPGLLDIENNDGRTPISLAAGDRGMLQLMFGIANMCKLKINPENQEQEQLPFYDEHKDFVLGDCTIL